MHEAFGKTLEYVADHNLFARTPNPVSYTHLDVYKRQAFIGY